MTVFSHFANGSRHVPLFQFDPRTNVHNRKGHHYRIIVLWKQNRKNKVLFGVCLTVMIFLYCPPPSLSYVSSTSKELRKGMFAPLLRKLYMAGGYWQRLWSSLSQDYLGQFLCTVKALTVRSVAEAASQYSTKILESLNSLHLLCLVIYVLNHVLRCSPASFLEWISGE